MTDERRNLDREAQQSKHERPSITEEPLIRSAPAQDSPFELASSVSLKRDVSIIDASRMFERQ